VVLTQRKFSGISLGEVMFFMKFHAQSKIINNFRWVSESEFVASAGSLHRGFNPAEVQQVFVEANDGFYDFPCPIEDHK
jgi:hypothetical protein